MTFQVALVGTDGIVLAGEKLADAPSLGRQMQLDSGILIDDRNHLTIACAGEELPQAVGERILEEPEILEQEYPYSPMEQLARSVQDQVRASRGRFAEPRGQLIAVTQKRLDRVFYMTLGEQQCYLSVRDDHAMIGRDQSAAKLAVEHFYRKAPVSELVFLAAHAVLRASKRISNASDFLEVVTCRRDGVERLSKEKLFQLASYSEALAERIREELTESLAADYVLEPLAVRAPHPLHGLRVVAAA